MVQLDQIFAAVPVKVLTAGNVPPLRITGITSDSRQVQPGFLFVAFSGGSTDGHQYISAAVERGAAAVVGTRLDVGHLSVPYIGVDDTRRALAYLAAAFYDFPARKLTMFGVTGTDGKTTTSNLLYHVLLAAGYKTGVISTVNAVIGGQTFDTGFHVTTPDAPQVQFYLNEMVKAGLTHVVLETTSHGWAQYRVDACEFDVGIVTNITHEHLDYHGSYEAYRAAKARLFTSLAETQPKPQGNPRLGVLNRDDASFDYLHETTPVQTVTYSLSQCASIVARNIRETASGILFDAVAGDSVVPVSSSLKGLYNVSNCLAAIAAAHFGVGVSLETAAKGIAALDIIPGRMERIDLGQNFSAIVDFAHTPNALEVSLWAARELASGGRVIAIFGSAGLRDREKRRMMAEVSARHADITILTAEDPRTESLDAILAEMQAAAERCGAVIGENLFVVPDRAAAIRMGVRLAQPGDLVMPCGKGHEQSMCFGTTEYAWDDRTAMRAALAEFLGVSGPEMPFLPTL